MNSIPRWHLVALVLGVIAAGIMIVAPSVKTQILAALVCFLCVTSPVIWALFKAFRGGSA